MFDDSTRLRLLHELGCAFAARTELEDLCRLVISKCGEALKAEGVGILLLDGLSGATAEWQPRYHIGRGELPNIRMSRDHRHYSRRSVMHELDTVVVGLLGPNKIAVLPVACNC